MAECIFVTGGCSPENEVVDVGPDGLYAYGSGQSVLIGELSGGQPKKLLVGTAHVHTVRIVSFFGPQSVMVVAAAADGSVSCWNLNTGECSRIQVPASVNALASSNDVICFSDINGSLYSARISPEGLISLDEKTISFAPKKIISLAISCDMPSVIFAGLSDNSLVVLSHSMEILLCVGGHSNWINSLDVVSPYEGTLLLASGSSDKSVRVWRIKPKTSTESRMLMELVPSKSDFALGPPSSSSSVFSIECETILYGHEAMIQSVRWDRRPQMAKGEVLVSAASDHTLILWKAPTSKDSGLWKSIAQLGEIANIGTVGGDRSFGFFSGLLSATENEEFILAHLSTGSIVKYSRPLGSDGHFNASNSAPIASGHVGEIKACSWQPNGTNTSQLLTVGSDKTTRLWSHYSIDTVTGWFEMGRPQIHGYEMQAVAFCDNDSFLSAGDEKILRSFKRQDGSEGVIVPALGLSNKAGANTSSESNMVASSGKREAPIDHPPTEYDLSRLTLWPETDKLYGHGLELYSLAVTKDGRYAASASKSSTTQDAAIRFWSRSQGESNSSASASEWDPLETTIVAHSLTVVHLCFSPNDQYLLSVSRDRHWAVMDVSNRSVPQLMQFEVGHSRIIWSAAWSPKSDFFVTVSRDRLVKTWINGNGKWAEFKDAQLEFACAATAVAITQINDSYLMALGLEDGTIHVFHSPAIDHPAWTSHVLLKHASGSSINDLAWRPDASGVLAAVSSIIQLFLIKLQ